MNPKLRSLEGRVAPDDSGVIERFPNWLSRFPHNEFLATEGGRRWCRIEGRVPKFADCEEYSREIEDSIRIHYPDEYTIQRENPLAFEGKGAFARVSDDRGTGIWEINFNTNPQKVLNQKAAITYVEQTVLQDLQFFDGEEKEILTAIKKTHEIFLRKLPVSMGVVCPGQYRTEALIVGGFQEFSREELERILRKRGGTQKDRELLASLMKKHEQYGIFEQAYEHFTEEELAAYKKLGHFAPMPNQIQKEMLMFAKRLKELGAKVRSRELSAISAAAWVHAELGRIHPFVDGNGRIARLWANAMLQLGGYRAVIFPDDEEYTQAIEADQSQAGQFASFLEETIAWARTQEALS